MFLVRAPLTPPNGRSVSLNTKATRQHHTTVDDQFHVMLSLQRLRVLQQWGHRR